MRKHGYTEPLTLTEATAASLFDILAGKKPVTDGHHKTYINTRRKKHG